MWRTGKVGQLSAILLAVVVAGYTTPSRAQQSAPPSREPTATAEQKNPCAGRDQAKGGAGDVDCIFDILRRLPPVVLVPGQPGQPVRPDVPGPGAELPQGPSGGGAPQGAPPGGPAGPQARPPLPPRNGPPAPVGPVLGADDQRDRVIVVSLPDSNDDDLERRIGAEVGIERETSFRSVLLGVRIVRYRISDDRPIATVLAAIAQRSGVVAVQPEYVYRPIQAAPGAAAGMGPQYALEKLRLGDAHKLSLGRNVRIAVVDTGIDAEHPEIKGALGDSFDAVGEGRLLPESHGTAIAGILAARGQLRGVSPEARIVSVRAFSTTGARRGSEATTTTIIKGIEWAALGGTRLMNLSFAGPRDQKLQTLLEKAEARGMIFVASVGNAGPKSPPLYPAAYASVIAVAAVDSADQVYPASVRGKHVTIAAPGVDILAAAPNGGYEMTSGTSMAAAHVSGVVALALERRPALTAAEVRELLRRTARAGSASPEEIGAGILDAARLIEAVQ